jgi:hypothetical protein
MPPSPPLRLIHQFMASSGGLPSYVTGLTSSSNLRALRFAVLKSSQAEIQEFDIAFSAQHYVGWFDVAMYKALRVCVSQRHSHLPNNLTSIGNIERPSALQQLP